MSTAAAITLARGLIQSGHQPDAAGITAALRFPGVDVSTLRAGVEFDVHAFARDYFPRYGAHEVEQALEDAGIEDYSVDPIEIADEISDVLVLNRKEMGGRR